MKISELKIRGSYLIEPELYPDDRGFFARVWCAREFTNYGIEPSFVQASLSFTRLRGSVRGMHYQRPPSAEGKLVRCTKGAVLDVIVDVRPDSDSFLEHESIELNSENRCAVFVPPGVAHGFQTLVDDVEMSYEMTDFYQPELADGFRWDDETLTIQWPREVTIVSERDANYPSIRPEIFEYFRGIARGADGPDAEN